MLAQTRGGGNCANALTAAARLGLDPYLVSKVGDDSIGDEIEQELVSDGVQTQFLLKAKGYPSPFTYIIVDKQGIILCNHLHSQFADVNHVHTHFRSSCILIPSVPANERQCHLIQGTKDPCTSQQCTSVDAVPLHPALWLLPIMTISSFNHAAPQLD